MKLIRLWLTLTFTCVNLFTKYTHGQDYKAIDSLQHIVKTSTKNNVVVDAYEELFWQYYGVYNDSTLFYAKKTLEFAESKKFDKGLLAGYRLMGMAYANLSNYPQALKYQQMALNKCDALKDLKSKANILNNLANINYELKDYKSALHYYQRSLELCQKLNIKFGVAACYGNMGNIYKNLKLPGTARDYYELSLKIDIELKNYRGVANSLSNIGAMYQDEKNYTKALEFFERALTVRDSIGHTEGKASSYGSLAGVYLDLDKTDEAVDYYSRALNLGEEIGAIDILESSYKGLYLCYKKQGKVNHALEAFEKYDLYKDSILNATRLEELSQLKTKFLIGQKDAEQKIKEEKSKTEIKAERQQRKLILISSICGLALMLIFSYLIYKRYKHSLRQQGIIQAQKKLVEIKNKEITDSINYAKRIQEAMLTSEKEYCSYFDKAFVLFKPKDIVSGDFYWINTIPGTNTILFVLGDCTGHGVPGGFMSVLGINLMNDIINDKQITEPAKILNALRERIKFTLKQDGAEGTSRDGMDLTIGKLNRDTLAFTYATANRMLYVHNTQGLTRYSGNKMPVGYFEKEETFTQETIQLTKGDLMYFFTDGFVDQIGGDLGRKFKYPNFEATLKQAYTDNKALDKLFFDKTFTDWKKHHHQVDDVCLIGMLI